MDQPRSSSPELAELVELARRAPGRIAERLASTSLRRQAALALSLGAAERLELLLHAPQPLRLVRSLPDAELYLTVREVGPTDALPLVALASAEQLHHVIDLEGWRGDRFDGDRAGAWVALMLEAGEPAVRRFLQNADEELLALLAQRWFKVRQIEPEGHGHEIHVLAQTEMGDEDGLVSPDGGHTMSPTIDEHAPAIQRIAQLFFLEQPERYRRALWTAVIELPSELEERALHWRQSRLEEHGFPPWDEAMGVYSPPDKRPAPPATFEPDTAAPRALLRLLPAGDPLAAAVAGLPDGMQGRVLHEMLSVANRLLVADAADTGDPATHRETLRNAAGYVTIGLAGRSRLETTSVIQLFRAGYARAVEVQAEARALTRDGWAAMHPRALELLEPRAQVLVRGLLEARPLYLEPGGKARPFRTVSELEESRVALRTAALIGRLMVDRLGLDVGRVLDDCATVGSDPPRFSAFLSTLLAWHAVRSELRGDALPGDVAADFLREIASSRSAPPDAPRLAMEALVARMADSFALSSDELDLLRGFGDATVERLVEECAGLDPGVPIDPRYVTCLLLKTEEA